LTSFLYSIDVAGFRWINEAWSCPFLDHFFSYITQFHHFEWPVLLWALYLLVWGKAKGRWLVLTVVITVLLTDQISSHVIKYLVERVRPCNALPDVLTPMGVSSAFSFPSSHAANMGGSMLVLSQAFPAFTWLFALVALLVGLSRVYLGLHYPSDVLSGYLLGIAIGWGVLQAIGEIRSRMV
jgi:undecaprenyl-diphosphatase